jgi:flagellar hook-associated protein 2
MSTISFTGLASGFDSNSVINSLVAAERQPATELQQHEADTNQQISTLGDLVSKLQSLGTTATGLSDATSIQSLSASTSDSSRVTISATGSAIATNYNLSVQQLARAQTSVSTTFGSDTAGAAGTGSLTLTVGAGAPVTINYGANDTLDTIASAINSSAAGTSVSASVMNVGKGYQLVVSSRQSGAANAISFQESGSGLGFTQPGSTVVSARDAAFTVNGIAVTRPSNVVSDLFSGVTFTLRSETPAGAGDTSLTVQTDVSGLQSKVQSIVDGYNTVANALNAQLSYNGQTKGPDTLFGDPALQALQRQMGLAFAHSYSSSGGTSSPAALGIKLASDGTLSIDPTAFAAAVNANPSAVQQLFLGDGSQGSGLIGGINTLVSQYTDFVSGVFVNEQASKRTLITTYDKEIQRINDHADSLGVSLRAQFAKLDQLMSQFNGQQSYLSALSNANAKGG